MNQPRAADQSVDQHIRNLLKHIMLSQPSNPYQNFENISHEVRLRPQSEQKLILDRFKDLETNFSKNKSLLAKLMAGTEEQPSQPGTLPYVPNLMDQFKIFQQVGVGLGEASTYKLFKSVTRFALKRSPKEIRFWGKILGQGKDYFVLQGLADSPDQQLSPDTQPRGVGVNAFNYWVTTDLTGEWTQLPLVTPTQIRISRRIKYIFKGDLEGKVISNPFFPGKQKHLLKCILARISTSVAIVPAGMYKVNPEDSRAIDPTQQYKLPQTDKLVSLQSWAHFPPSIINNGRTTIIKPANSDEDPNVLKEAMAKDPYQPRIKTLDKDKDCWKLKVFGDLLTKNLYSKGQQVCYAIIAIRSLVWPGAITVFHQGKSQTLYVGFGFKQKSNYFPSEPQKVMCEKADREGFKEPNFPAGQQN